MMMSDSANSGPGFPPPGVDPTTPSAARLYDHYLGGKDNYQSDRETARRLLAEDPATTAVVGEDLRHPETILEHPETQRLIDFTRPVGLLLVAVLHFFRDADRPYEVVAQLRDALCSGSFIAISHVDNETAPERAAYLEEVYARTSAPGQTRSRAEILRFFDGFDLIAPGLTYIADWRPEPGDTYFPPEQAWGLGGIGHIPPTT